MTSFRETCVALDADGNPLAWGEGSGAYIPDEDGGMWSVVMETAERRARLHAVAHTHPGAGVPRPSTIDLDSFRAAEKALGRPIVWYIVSADEVVVIDAVWAPTRPDESVYDQPWLTELRARSWRTA